MFRAALISLCLLGSTQAFAQTVTGPDSQTKDVINKVLNHLVLPIVALRPEHERDILSEVEIRIEPDGPFPGPQTATRGDERAVLLPELFVVFLGRYIEAAVLGDIVDEPYLPEWWLDYALWRTPVFDANFWERTLRGRFYRGEPPRRASIFAGMTEDQSKAFASETEATRSALYVAALTDILLHQLGHHANGHWHDPNAVTPAEEREMDEQADEWASSAFKTFANADPVLGGSDKRNSMGRLFAMEYLFALSRWWSTEELETNQTYLPFVSRVSSTLDGLECLITDAATVALCETLDVRLKALAAQIDTEANYRERAENGEAFAAYRLGQILFGRNDFAGACDLMMSATGPGPELDRAQHYRGLCYEYSLSGTDLTDAARKQLAIEAFQAGADVGWSDSLWGLGRLGALQ